MILYHGTTPEAWARIQDEGLRPRIPKSQGGWGLIYLSPKSEIAQNFGEVVLEVETDDLKLTAFEDCKDWEVLCWLEGDAIEAEKVRVLGVKE